jgi:hypothetical protein
VTIIVHGPFVEVAALEAALDALPREVGDLFRLSVLPPVPGTVRVKRVTAIDDTPGSMNENELRAHWKGFAAAKKLWQGWFARALHGLDLERPISRTGRLWVHVTLRFPERRTRDIADNFRFLLAKALGDALTGKGRRGRAIFVDHRRYVCGWLLDDGARDWILTVAIDEDLGPHCTTVQLTWDQAVG